MEFWNLTPQRFFDIQRKSKRGESCRYLAFDIAILAAATAAILVTSPLFSQIFFSLRIIEHEFYQQKDRVRQNQTTS